MTPAPVFDLLDPDFYRRDPHDAYVAFRGRTPSIDGLLRKRGLAA